MIIKDIHLRRPDAAHDLVCGEPLRPIDAAARERIRNQIERDFTAARQLTADTALREDQGD